MLFSPGSHSSIISELEEQFRIVDLNKDGFIDAEELKKVMKNLGMKHSDEEISMMLQYADINGERRQFGLISFRFTGYCKCSHQQL